MWVYHVVALVTALVWSTTFVSTKMLLNAGLSPEAIFIYRFLIAYVGILVVSHDQWRARSWKDEGLLLLAGITGGSLYFYTENTALRFTYTSNVSILISTTPLITMFLAAIVYRQPFRRTMFLGSLLALAGVSLVVLNGRGVEGVSPLGDFLTMVAAVCWSVYSIAVTALGKRNYPSLFITRKIFFYGLLTMCMFFPFSGCSMRFELLKDPVVVGNILFLGVIAS
ncbi:MAG: DMT family transporter [Duncaniella sp.]|nr:DMT family transporter [Duncaniella sp.]